MFSRHQAASHGPDTVNRKNGWLPKDFQSRMAGPVFKVFCKIINLCWYRVRPELVDTIVYGVENSTYKKRLPVNFKIQLVGQ